MSLTAQQIRKLCGNLVPPGTLTSADPSEFKERTLDQQAIHEICANALGTFAAKSPKMTARPLVKGESVEWDLLVDKYLSGKWFGQNSGSCVITNCSNILLCQIVIESLLRATGEEIDAEYFWGPSYGWGRHFGGMDDEGGGSYLSVQLRAFMEKGLARLNASPDFPKYTERDGARWIPGNVEKWWARQPNYGTKYDSLMDDHLIVDGAMIPSGRDWQDGMQQMITALDSGPVFYAGMLGFDKLTHQDGLTIGEWDTNWSHNMGVSGKRNHPKFGLMFDILNKSWLPSEYSKVSVTEKTMVKVVKHNATELAVVRDFNGVWGTGVDVEWLLQVIANIVASLENEK